MRIWRKCLLFDNCTEKTWSMIDLALKSLVSLLSDVRMTNIDMGSWLHRLVHGIFSRIPSHLGSISKWKWQLLMLCFFLMASITANGFLFLQTPAELCWQDAGQRTRRAVNSRLEDLEAAERPPKMLKITLKNDEKEKNNKKKNTNAPLKRCRYSGV